LIRLLQAFGAYGYRGLFEQKPLFKESIPYGIQNLEWVLKNNCIAPELPALKDTLKRITESKALKNLGKKSNELTLHIKSFSYRNGIPEDPTGHGGGYVFDCRLLPNPGLYEEYKSLTGKDPEVNNFLEHKPEVIEYREYVQSILEKSAEAYLQKGYTDLSIFFGCTGGQHRSVYMADCIANALKQKYPLQIDLTHRELME
jgi:RNase adaptor protein for sRNA GlmZ degradation